MNPLREAHRGLLKYAVQRHMFNSDGSVADVRRSVLVEVNIAGRSTVELMTAEAFDKLPDLEATVAQLPAGSTVEVWDGRYLFGSRRGDGYRLYTTDTLAPVEPVDQLPLF